MPVELTIDQQALQALNRALKSEADGKKLRRDLGKNIRQALEPAKAAVRSELMGMGTSGLPVAGPPLRATVLGNLKAEARFSGRATGARLRIRKKGMPRGFANAPKRLNQKRGWRHKVFGRDVWVTQVGKPDYFHRPLRHRKDEFRAAVLQAMEDMAQRIAKKV